jgi:serine phosphatase RsbU (regulator of sigma subunit)/ligand-binding sensor domain-containing protein
MKYRLKLIALLLFLFYKASAQDAIYPVTNYTTKNYGRDFNPVNQAIAQDQRGIIYAANGFKLLEFDGSSWKSYPISKETWILSLAVDSTGLVYVGSQNEFGFFAPDKRGELKYHSLSDSLDQKDRDFTNIWKVHAFAGGVVFQSEEKLFIYRKGKIKALKPETSFHTSFIVNNRLFVRQRGIGLMEWKDDGVTRINGSEIFDTTGVFMMVPFGRAGNKILIGTREKGFWLLEPDGKSYSFRRFKPADDDLLEKAVITGGILTGDGSVAIGTMLNGVIVIDTAGRTKAIINTKNGLSDNNVKQLITDRGHNLWLALNNGISRVEISSPLSVLAERSGITGSINTIIRHESLLYAGTTNGLLVQAADKESEVPFKPVSGLSVPVWSIINADGSLLAGTDAGLYQISGNRIIRIDNEESFALFYSPELKFLFSGGQKGLRAYRFDGSFKKTDILKIEGEDIIGITAENNSPGNVAELWLGTRYSGLIRIRVNKDLSFTSDRYNNSDGLPDGWVIPASFESKTVFETTRGLYVFTNENIVKESVPDSLKNNKNFTKGYFSALLNINREIGETVSFLSENNNKVWICSDNSVGYLDKRDSMKYVGTPFRGIEAGRINTIYPEANGICWIGTTDGLIRYDENTGKDYNQDYLTLIRKVTLLDNDSAIFLGDDFMTEQGCLKIITKQPSALIPALPYRDNSLRLEFSAPFYEYHGKIIYSYRLEGRSSKWSQWTKEDYQEFTNLKEGNYRFSVKATNLYGRESALAQYSFTILPPWYRSLPAYITYIIFALILFWLFARLYSLRLKRENIRLEGIVSERTAEVVRQKDEIVQKNVVLELQKKEIEDSIRYARRIQSAVIPSEKVCRELFPGSFVFFRPLNIVSGDFYWISNAGNKIVFAAADCTGHGVPGAFMSMLGVAFLNEIVNKDHITVPDLILNQLRDKVIQALQQHGVSGEARDGMDIAIVSMDREAGKLEFAGAYNPLIMIRKGEISEIAGDKMPIGIYDNMRAFSKHEMTIEKGDVFYMFSDGYEDQFGGPEGKKFKSKRLKNLLLEICNYPVDKQKETLERNFEEWKGDLPQVDDIVVVGIAIK